jgi:hypothetical protein
MLAGTGETNWDLLRRDGTGISYQSTIALSEQGNHGGSYVDKLKKYRHV